MRCRNCGQTQRISLLIELSVQIDRCGTRRLPEWSVGTQCPRCASTDVEADTTRLLSIATGAEGV